MRSVTYFMIVFCCSWPLFAENPQTSAMDVFRQRIEPIWKSSKPSSCSECHLSGVDLKAYLREDQTETFVALRDAGLIDLKRPDDSKLLQFVARKPERPSLVIDEVRQKEFEALREWIRLAVKDPELIKSKPNTDSALNLPPVEVIRHARSDHVLDSFVENVWSEIGRCAACHSPDRNAEQQKKHGARVSWIKPRDPAGTLAYMLETKVLDIDSPEDSQLLLKPTMQVPHGGGKKLEIGDRTYKQFIVFLIDYASVVKAKYRTAKDLPPPRRDVSRVTDIWLKIEGVPERFHQRLLQVDVFRQEGKGWSKVPWAIGDRAVFGPNKLWQQHLTLMAPRDTPRALQIKTEAGLPPGKYLVRVAIDANDRLKENPAAILGDAERVAEIEVESSWAAGYGSMTVIQFPNR
jgi:hypothetical protein